MSRLCLYFRRPPETDRWLPGDRWIRPLVRRLVRGPHVPGGVEKVFTNLCLGLDRIGAAYRVNLPFSEVRADDHVVVLGVGRHALAGYDRPNPILAGIGLMTHPSEWPTLCQDYPVKLYLQHSEWAAAVYRPVFGDRVRLWPAGIDTREWTPASAADKTTDFLIYDKLRWDHATHESALVAPLRAELARRGLTTRDLRYGRYRPKEFREALDACRAMIFLCSHESQGLACLEAMSCNVPVFAWNPGEVLDPERFKWGQPHIRATSVPFFDARCGLTFTNATEFTHALPAFVAAVRSGAFSPRSYVVENLTVEASAEQLLELVAEAWIA